MQPARVILVDGILVLTSRELRELMDIKIFVDTEADIRFIRRLRRDISERGRTVDSCMVSMQHSHACFVSVATDTARICSHACCTRAFLPPHPK